MLRVQNIVKAIKTELTLYVKKMIIAITLVIMMIINR